MFCAHDARKARPRHAQAKVIFVKGFALERDTGNEVLMRHGSSTRACVLSITLIEGGEASNGGEVGAAQGTRVQRRRMSP